LQTTTTTLNVSFLDTSVRSGLGCAGGGGGGGGVDVLGGCNGASVSLLCSPGSRQIVSTSAAESRRKKGNPPQINPPQKTALQENDSQRPIINVFH
jgi:hypothetical protein